MMGHYGLDFGKDIPDANVKKMKTPLAKTAKKYNKIGIILSIILFIISIVATLLFAAQGLGGLANFPIA